jgi:hypothetical protein
MRRKAAGLQRRNLTASLSGEWRLERTLVVHQRPRAMANLDVDGSVDVKKRTEQKGR